MNSVAIVHALSAVVKLFIRKQIRFTVKNSAGHLSFIKKTV